MTWREELDREAPLLGHRNWILVADAAYPQQCAPGIATLSTGEGLLPVLKEVLAKLSSLGHVRPVAVLDEELFHLDGFHSESLGFREQLMAALAGTEKERVLHEDLLKLLSETAQTYRILVIKTTSAIPYTSVFLRLECGYWLPRQEAAFRKGMEEGA